MCTIAPGGCQPQPLPYPYPPEPRPWPGPGPWNRGPNTGNLPDSWVGTERKGCWGFDPVKGYGLDLNGDGRYTRGKDGVLAFDINRDGKVTNEEIEESNARLKAFGGNYDANGDGKTSFCERISGQRRQREMAQYDRNQDGRLDTNELNDAGGRVLVDRNQDGKFQPWENHSPYDFPTPGFGRGRLDFVDPYNNNSRVSNKWNWCQPPYPQPQPCRCH